MSHASSTAHHVTDFSQAEQCQAFFRRINVTDPDEAIESISVLLEGMAVSAPAPDGQLQLLEELRPTLDFILGEIAKRYASHPLPPSGNEQYVLQQVVRLWSLMVSNYGFVGQRFGVSGASVPDERKALLLQRRLHYQALAMIEYFRARQELPPNLWRDLHNLYLAAEQAGMESVRVQDSLNEIWGAQSPQECYVAMLLFDVASPYGCTPREFSWLVRWAQRFAPYCTLQNEIGEQANLYLLEPGSDHGLRPAAALRESTGVRSLHTTRLARHIQKVVAQLKAGVPAASIGLGEDCVQPACSRLMVSLYRPWGLASAGRKFPRRTAAGQLRLCTDLLGTAFFLQGRKFEPPETDQVRFNDFSRTEVMLTLGARVPESDLTAGQIIERARELGYVLEEWDVLNQSVTGFRLRRGHPGSRVDHQQLLGVRLGENGSMLLAEISWLQYLREGSLCAGISLLPGPPRVVAVRLNAAERQGARDRYRLGFILPAVPTLKTDISLIVPAGWYVAGRCIDVHDEVTWTARMVRLTGRGANFDRVTFTQEDSDAAKGSAP